MKARKSSILNAVDETAMGLHKAGVMDDVTMHALNQRGSPTERSLKPSSKELGDDGEHHTCELLRSRGYDARLLQINARTYDLHVQKGHREFLVSVKVARDKQHVRLGSRRSVLGLEAGNFVFAYLPNPGQPIGSLKDSPHTLLILPAEIAQVDALSIHDPYWIEKEKDPNIFSVMVKGYGSHHRGMWPRWLEYANAWHLLP